MLLLWKTCFQLPVSPSLNSMCVCACTHVCICAVMRLVEVEKNWRSHLVINLFSLDCFSDVAFQTLCKKIWILSLGPQKSFFLYFSFHSFLIFFIIIIIIIYIYIYIYWVFLFVCLLMSRDTIVS